MRFLPDGQATVVAAAGVSFGYALGSDTAVISAYCGPRRRCPPPWAWRKRSTTAEAETPSATAAWAIDRRHVSGPSCGLPSAVTSASRTTADDTAPPCLAPRGSGTKVVTGSRGSCQEAAAVASAALSCSSRARQAADSAEQFLLRFLASYTRAILRA